MPASSLRLRLGAACLASGLIAAACAASAPEPAPSSELAGTRWVALAIDGAPIAGPRRPELAFLPEDRIAGNGGCNRLFGVYEAKSGFIDVRGLGRTEMACEPPVMNREEAFLEILRRAARYERSDDRLIIVGEDGRRLTLTASG